MKPVSHLLCMFHYKSDVTKLQSCNEEMTKIKIEGNMDMDSEYFFGDTFPYCTTNWHDNAVEQKVCYICCLYF